MTDELNELNDPLHALGLVLDELPSVGGDLRQVPDTVLAGGPLACAAMASNLRFCVLGGLAVLLGACSSKQTGDPCTPGDQDGINEQPQTVFATVSDAAFAEGGVDSGSTERNFTTQNSSTVTFRLTNVGTKPHDFAIGCRPTGLPDGCPQTSCFPADANFAPLAPGETETHTFMTPAVEGAYEIRSDVQGDSQKDADGGFSGLTAEFVLE